MECGGGLPCHEAEEPAHQIRVYRVRIRMDGGQPDRWLTMLGCTDDDDARKSASNTFGEGRVATIIEHKPRESPTNE